MLKIAICDDEQYIRDQVKKYIQLYSKENNIQFIIYTFEAGEKLIEEYDELKEHIDIIFLDIQMGMLNGIETAKKIRESDENVVIVFITALTEYAKEGYTVQAYNYLVKPLNYNIFKAAFLQIVKRAENNMQRVIIVCTDKGIWRIVINDIIYIETYGKKTIIHTKNEEIESYYKIGELEEILEKHFFFRCHTGFLVNFTYISKEAKGNIEMVNGDMVPLSKYRKKEFMKAFTNYMGELL